MMMNKIRLDIVDKDYDEEIFKGIVSPTELGKILKKIKHKYS